MDGVRGTNEQFLRYLKGNYLKKEHVFEPIELVGTATPSTNWAVGHTMIPQDEDWKKWVIELELSDGVVKFRAGSSWVFDWGRGEFDTDRLVFKGANIPVTAGTYRISIDIEQGTYVFKPIP